MRKMPNLKFEKLNRVRRHQYVTAAQNLTDLVLSGLQKERRKAIVSEVAAGAADFEVLVGLGVALQRFRVSPVSSGSLAPTRRQVNAPSLSDSVVHPASQFLTHLSTWG